MENQYFLEPAIEEKEATSAIKEHKSGLIMRLFEKEKKQLKSMELSYLPFWCYSYELKSTAYKDKICGKVAIEAVTKTSAILPVEYPLQQVGDDMNLLPIVKEEDEEMARKALYWEAFRKEKKRKSIDIKLNPSFVLYLPFWIGYLSGDERIEILPVDAITRKIDLKLKDAFLEIFKQM
ncbi:hypothetical protein ACTWQL_24160 [Pseudalkalibacillus sp. R45]|uniref:hypothetical protein n=1 Tax=Pseudalkalibacillus sp. R45 TaxID=3457433 RepID=UPI003FCEB011